MDLRSLLELLGPHVGVVLVSFVSALVPLVNLEAFLLAAALIAPGSYPVWTLGVAAGFGQMCGKTLLYLGGGSVLQTRIGRRISPERVDALRRRVESMRPWWLAGLNFISASVGVPPFLIISIVAGMIGMRFWHFVATGLAGRTLRFVAFVAFPHALKGLLA